jgi:dTDP-4-dehydrorhamnose reductase
VSGGILVVGGTGLVGNALLRAWRARGEDVSAATYHCHPSASFLQLDMQDESAVRALIGRLRPSLVAVPAANPYVDDCERRPAETRKVNVDGTLNVARACREAGARMIFFSSDYVFDGAKGGYTEEDPVSPLNEYGRQKAETERGVLAVDARNLVIRTSGAYGWQWEPKNFVLQIRAGLSEGRELRVADDVVYNPTYVEDLAEITSSLAAAGAAGVVQVVGANALSRSEFALRAARAFGLSEGLIRPVPSSSLPSPTRRPKNSSLRTDRLRAAYSIFPLGVDEGLRRMIAQESAWREYAKTLPSPPSARPA